MDILSELLAACPAVTPQEPLSRHTSLCIGGPADYYIEVMSVAELIALRKLVARHKLPVFFLGAGSNLLVADRGIRGVVVHLQGEFRRIEFKGALVEVGAAVMLPTLARQAAEKGFAGLESLAGVPGTIGGGLVMNAGTREGWLGSVVSSIDVVGDSLRVETLTADAFGFAYRKSNLEGRWILSARLALKSEEPASIMKRIETLLQYRSRTQPLATSNCGSVFKNPPEGPAAQWIERAGFKGVLEGGARVSERHANFIINENKATAHHVRTLMTRIQEKVLQQFNVHLEPEVKLVGEW
jgi:UDP-N-acetylmuramate dehydrogenase